MHTWVLVPPCTCTRGRRSTAQMHTALCTCTLARRSAAHMRASMRDHRLFLFCLEHLGQAHRHTICMVFWVFATHTRTYTPTPTHPHMHTTSANLSVPCLRATCSGAMPLGVSCYIIIKAQPLWPALAIHIANISFHLAQYMTPCDETNNVLSHYCV